MPTLYDKPATSALNEDKYINKLYDTAKDEQTKVLQDGYNATNQQITQGQQNTQQQTNDYLQRAYVEGSRAQQNYKAADTARFGAAAGSGAQSRLSFDNSSKVNNTALNKQQSAADVEYERQRKLLADQYAAQIKQAEADNDRERAQQLYNAAKAEEEQLRTLRQSGAPLLAQKGDNALIDAIANGEPVQRDTETETWDGVTRNEEGINKIYDAMLESARQQAQIDYDKKVSELEAKQLSAQRDMNTKLNDTYVDALRKAQNYQEVQNAYGQTSGAAEQAMIARETGLSEDLTDIRRLMLGQDAESQRVLANIRQAYGDAISKARASGDQKRAEELIKAAEQEEQNLVKDQQMLGEYLAKQNGDYSVLARLYGLTDDQIDRIMGRGAYAPAPVYSGGGGGGEPVYYGSYTPPADTPAASGNGGTTSVPSNTNSVIALGKGPISSNTLANMVANGSVTVTPSGYTNTRPTAGAALPAAVTAPAAVKKPTGGLSQR